MVARLIATIASIFCLVLTVEATADTLTFRHLGDKVTRPGTVTTKYQDGTVLLEGLDTQLYLIPPSDIIDWQNKKTPLKPWSREQLRAALRKEYGGDFAVQLTSHYAIVYDCDPALAEQAATLLERAYAVFRARFAHRGAFVFEDLRQPLIAIIFKSRREYLDATKQDLGSTLGWSAGLYAQTTNRFYMFDASEGAFNRKAEVVTGGKTRKASSLDGASIEVIVHEGTHQLAFNFGIHTRRAANPVWFVEGLATYFEASDADSAEGWSRAGELNPGRLAQFQSIMEKLPKGFLDTLVTRDQLFHDPSTNGNAYAEAWALTYFLMRTKQTGYVRYVRANQAHGLMPFGAKERLEDFKKAFGTTPSGMEVEFRRYMAGISSPGKTTAAANLNRRP